MNQLVGKSPCPCTSNKALNKCCGRFLNSDDAQYPKTPEQLMRSRFSAYKLGGYGQYLINTWAVETCPTHNPIELNTPDLDWQHLDILDKSIDGNSGIVEFKAYYLEPDGSLAYLHERSSFVRAQGKWLYVKGEIY